MAEEFVLMDDESLEQSAFGVEAVFIKWFNDFVASIHAQKLVKTIDAEGFLILKPLGGSTTFSKAKLDHPDYRDPGADES